MIQASCSLNSRASPILSGPGTASPRDRIESHIEHIHIQQTQVGFYLGKSEMPIYRLRPKISKILKATQC